MAATMTWYGLKADLVLVASFLFHLLNGNHSDTTGSREQVCSNCSYTIIIMRVML